MAARIGGDDAMTEAEMRLAVARREIVSLRKELRRARPVDVPSFTASLHLIEAILDGTLSVSTEGRLIAPPKPSDSRRAVRAL